METLASPMIGTIQFAGVARPPMYSLTFVLYVQAYVLQQYPATFPSPSPKCGEHVGLRGAGHNRKRKRLR